MRSHPDSAIILFHLFPESRDFETERERRGGKKRRNDNSLQSISSTFGVQTMSSDILSQNRNDVQKLAELSNVLRLVGGSLITALTASNIGVDITSAKNISTSKC